jgi:hypothetical protein
MRNPGDRINLTGGGMQIWVALALSCVPFVIAGAQRVSGTVRATGTLSTISEVTVTVLDSVGAAVAQGRTSNDGRYSIAIEADARQIRATRIGYRPVVLNIPPANGDAIVDVVMDVFRELDTVVTKAPEQRYHSSRLQDFEKRRLSGMGGHFVSEDVLRKMENVSMPSILRARFPGIRLVSYRSMQFAASSSAPGGNIQSVDPPKGPKGCFVSIYLDGILIFDGVLKSYPGSSEYPPDINNIMAMNLSGVEYYPAASSVPLQYKNLRNNCGSLLFWIRGR